MKILLFTCFLGFFRSKLKQLDPRVYQLHTGGEYSNCTPSFHFKTSHSAIFEIPVRPMHEQFRTNTADQETCNAWAVNFDIYASDALKSLKSLNEK